MSNIAIKIEGARLSFPDLFEATQVNGKGAAAFRSQLLVPASGSPEVRATIATGKTEDGKPIWGGPWGPARKVIQEAIEMLAKQEFKDKAKQILAMNEGNPQKHCFIDGAKRPYDGYDGMWALSANRQEKHGRPVVVDQRKNPLQPGDGKPYAGCYVNASVELWPQDNEHGKAIRCGLNAIQFVKDGDSFGGGGTPATADDFAEIAEGADADDLM